MHRWCLGRCGLSVRQTSETNDNDLDGMIITCAAQTSLKEALCLCLRQGIYDNGRSVCRFDRSVSPSESLRARFELLVSTPLLSYTFIQWFSSVWKLDLEWLTKAQDGQEMDLNMLAHISGSFCYKFAMSVLL